MNSQKSEVDLPYEEEINNYYKNHQNIIKSEFQNNNDNSNTIILNKQGDIPFNKSFKNNSINNYLNKNIKNENINNKENSFSKSSSVSAAPSLNPPKGSNPKNGIQQKEIEIKKPSLYLENNNIKVSEENFLKNNNSNKTQPIIIKMRTEEKTEENMNKCKKISILIVLYISSITNNIIFYLLVSIIDKLRNIDG